MSEDFSQADHYPFGSLMPGRVYNAADYRYGFNGMEKDDELKGLGNSYDFGARIQDPRLGRWLSLDPKWKAYPYVSNYSFGGNNPIFYVDVAGEILKGADEQSGARLLTTVQSTFKDCDALKSVFKLQEDGMTFESITEDEFNQAISGLDESTQQLARGYYQAINTQDKEIIVSMKANNEKIVSENSAIRKEDFPVQFSKGIDDATMDATAGYGGGQTDFGNNGKVLVLVNTDISSTDVDQTRLVNEPFAPIQMRSGSTEETTAHEVIGEALLDDRVKAVQVSNLTKKVMGQDYYRTGGDHSGINPKIGPPQDDSRVTAVPEELKK